MLLFLGLLPWGLVVYPGVLADPFAAHAGATHIEEEQLRGECGVADRLAGWVRVAKAVGFRLVLGGNKLKTAFLVDTALLHPLGASESLRELKAAAYPILLPTWTEGRVTLFTCMRTP